MAARSTQLRSNAAWWFAGMMLPIGLLVALGIWTAYRDLQRLRAEVLNEEIGRLRPVAIRRAALLESKLNAQASSEIVWSDLRGELSAESPIAKTALAPHQSYAAVVDETGMIVLHTQAERI